MIENDGSIGNNLNDGSFGNNQNDPSLMNDMTKFIACDAMVTLPRTIQSLVLQDSCKKILYIEILYTN